MAKDADQDVEEAQRLLAEATEAKSSADPRRAVERARLAWRHAVLGGVPVLRARAWTVESEALAMLDELTAASKAACSAAVLLAEPPYAGGEDHVRAMCQVFEVREIMGEFKVALEGFRIIFDGLPLEPGWRATVATNICDHFLSLAKKLDYDEVLARRGVKEGEKAADLADSSDAVASLDQWRALFDCGVGRVEQARERFDASLPLRAPTVKRDITRRLPDATITAAEGDLAGAIATLDDAVALAEQHDMLRYVHAARDLRRRFRAAA